MGSTIAADGRRNYDDRYNLPGDLQDLSDDLYGVANVRTGTAAEREAFPVAQRKAGMLWSESDTGSIYRAAQSDLGWRLVVEPILLPRAVIGGTVDTTGTIIPNAGATLIRLDGVFSNRYRAYEFHFAFNFTAPAATSLKLTKDGSPETGGYNAQRLVSSGTSTTSSASSNQSSWPGAGVIGEFVQGKWSLTNPAHFGPKWAVIEAQRAVGTEASIDRGWLGAKDNVYYDGIEFQVIGQSILNNGSSFIKVRGVI